MINGINALFIVSIVLLETLSQYLTRKFYDSGQNIKKIWYMVIAFSLYALILYLLLKTYDFSAFAISNAFWDSGTIIGTSLVGYFVFNESFKKEELVGLGLVIAGAILLGIYSEDVSKKK